MSDVLKSSSGVMGFGNILSMYGIATLQDNRGNSTNGHSLICRNGEGYYLGATELATLHGDVESGSFLDFRMDNKIPLPAKEQSPLETVCHDLHARFHSAETKKPAQTR